MVTRVTVIYKPFSGSDFRVNFYVAGAVVDPNNAALQAIVSAINGVTRAVAVQIELTVINDVADTAVVGAAYVSEDKAQFTYVDDGGHPHNYKVPGILAALLEANKETVDLTAPAVITYNTAMLANARGRGGADITTLVSATRRENRKLLKSASRL